MKPLTRRVFVGATVAGAAGAVAAAWVLRGDGAESEPTAADGAPADPTPPDPPELAAIKAEVRGALPWLLVAPAVLDQFAADHVRARGRKIRGYETNGLPEQFLLSTDFFRHGADQTRPVTYVAYFDPYLSPCYDPMAS